MSIIRMVPTSGKGVSAGCGVIIKAINDHKDNLLEVYRIKFPTGYTHIAIFQEPNLICGIVALINELGSRMGSGGGGTGVAYYNYLDKCFEHHAIQLEEKEFDNLHGLPPIEGNYYDDVSSINDLSTIERLELWEKFLLEDLYICYPTILPRERIEKMKNPQL